MLVVAIATVLLVAGCSDRGEEGGSDDGGGGGTTSVDSMSSTFGTLDDVCQSGSPAGAPTQGVTDTEIKVGVFTDIGFTQNPEFVNAAKVFTSWCNDQGGINGRKIVANTRDAKFMEARQQMVTSCREDFVLVGGGSGLDGLGVKERLNCLLPSFPAQVAQLTSAGADLEISADPSLTQGYDAYYGFRSWLINEKYPQSKGAVGFVNGDSPVTKVLGAQAVEGMEAAGADIIYNDLYPAMGVSDWTPYAQAIKSKGVKGLLFYGDFKQLAKLETVLTGMDYKLDWIDTNNNAYGPEFIELAGTSIEFQNNYLDLGGNLPLNSDEPAMQDLLALYEKYAPDANLTLPSIRAMSSWLLFAKAAASCGDDLTRTCVYNAAKQETEWTGGGLHTAHNLAAPVPPTPCFNVAEAEPDGWIAPDFGADEGAYRCNIPVYKFTGDYPKPMTLADIGKSMKDVQ
jgi:ABC-type branched-subunit amino acid transport system substrate-binding protein